MPARNRALGERSTPTRRGRRVRDDGALGPDAAERPGRGGGVLCAFSGRHCARFGTRIALVPPATPRNGVSHRQWMGFGEYPAGEWRQGVAPRASSTTGGAGATLDDVRGT